MTYWANDHLFGSGGDPYSASAMYAIERGLGWNYQQPLVLLNPPWALPLVSLLSAVPYHAARVAWLAISLLLESISSLALWRYFGGSRNNQWMALALVATFLPAGAAEQMGQITPLMLVGLTAILFALRRQQYLLAGICLLTLGFKPHLVYLVILAIVLWAAQTRKWSLILGAIFTYAAATIGALRFSENVLQLLSPLHSGRARTRPAAWVVRCAPSLESSTSGSSSCLRPSAPRGSRSTGSGIAAPGAGKKDSPCFFWCPSPAPHMPGHMTMFWRCRRWSRSLSL